jgi:Protein of unknown function (DUF3108)
MSRSSYTPLGVGFRSRRWLALGLIAALHLWLLASDLWTRPSGRAAGVVAAVLLAQAQVDEEVQPRSARRRSEKEETKEATKERAARREAQPPDEPARGDPESSGPDALAAAVSSPLSVASAALPLQQPAPMALAPLGDKVSRQAWPVMRRWPESMRIQFALSGTISGIGYSGSSNLVWRKWVSRYQMQMDATVFLIGTATQTSQGSIVDTGLAPTRFSNKRPRGSEQAAHLNHEKNSISFSANTDVTPLLAGAQDRLSVFMQLSAWAAHQPEPPKPGTRMTVQVVDVSDAEDWTFVVQGLERLHTESGELDTLKLSRAPRRAFDRQIELWLAPQMGHLPVHIRLTEHNGDFVDQVLRGVENLPQDSSP